MILDKIITLAISHPVTMDIISRCFDLHNTAAVQFFMIWPRIPKCIIPVF